MFPTFGAFDGVSVDGGDLAISGWLTTEAQEPIDAIQICNGLRILPQGTAALHLPSPDVMRHYPTLKNADQCRFQLRVPITPEESEHVSTSLLRLIPQSQGRDLGSLPLMLESPLPPPRPEDIALVGGGFLQVACSFLSYMIDLAGLTPDCDVLDVGCGFGRIAHAFVNYLHPSAHYAGFDVVPRMIDWAQTTITPRYPNFEFKCVDLYNATYNPNGKLQSRDLRFPYEDSSFDMVFLTSVFTHMHGDDVRHYLDEIRRVLRPGGRCLATCFLLNDETHDLIRQGRSLQNLVHPFHEGFVADLANPEQAIGFPEPAFLGWISDRGFSILGEYLGVWRGQAALPYYQDMVVFKK